MGRFRKLSLVTFAVLLAFPWQARAADTGGISGKVSGAGGVPLGGICVEAGERFSERMWWSTTADDGTYSFQSLPSGRYLVHFRDCRDEPSYLSHWYADAESYWDADDVEVADQEVSGIDVSLDLAGSISGTVLDDEGNPARTCIAATDEYGYRAVSVAFTDADGRYTLRRMRPGEDARVLFGDCDRRPEYDGFPWGSVTSVRPSENQPQGFVMEWYENQRSAWDATIVPVVAGVDTPAIDAVLEIAGGITGTITEEAGTPLKDMCVTAYSDSAYGSAMTGEDGFFSLAHLAAGDYEVRFDDCYRSVYLSEYFDDAPSSILADSVAVIRKIWTEDINASLAKRPRPDLAVTRIQVHSVPVVVDDVHVASNPWRRKVTVDFANVGNAYAADDAFLRVWVRNRSDGRDRYLGSVQANLGPGQEADHVFDWEGLGTVGDVYVFAQACAYDDGNGLNDYKVVESYVIAGGTGYGFGVTGSNPDPSACWY